MAVKSIGQKLEETTRLATRRLDNLIDINTLSVVEAMRSDKANRAVGLGVMGFADAVERLGYSYDNPEAWISPTEFLNSFPIWR